MVKIKSKITPIVAQLEEAIRNLKVASKMGYSIEYKAAIEEAEMYIEDAMTDIRCLQRK